MNLHSPGCSHRWLRQPPSTALKAACFGLLGFLIAHPSSLAEVRDLLGESWIRPAVAVGIFRVA
jgi:hypothetical protein